MAGGEGSGARVIRAALEGRVQALLSGEAGLPPGLARRFIVSTILTVIGHALRSDSDDSAEAMQRQSRKARRHRSPPSTDIAR